jgi:hypothetical protein
MEHAIYEFLRNHHASIGHEIPMSRLATQFGLTQRNLRDVVKSAITVHNLKICSNTNGYYAPDFVSENDIKPLVKAAETSMMRIFRVGGRKELDKLFHSVYSTINKEKTAKVHPNQMSLF